MNDERMPREHVRILHMAAAGTLRRDARGRCFEKGSNRQVRMRAVTELETAQLLELVNGGPELRTTSAGLDALKADGLSSPASMAHTRLVNGNGEGVSR